MSPDAPDTSSAQLEVDAGLAIVTLNRPSARNGMNQSMANDLYAIARRLDNDDSVRAVLIVGRGTVFSVGGDIGMFVSTTETDRPVTLRDLAARYHDALELLARLDKPVVSAVHGAVAGAAMGLVYVSDIAIAAEGTKFALGFGGIGLTGDGGASWFLPRFVGVRRAAEMYFENLVLSAQEAVEWGLITRVVPAEDMAEHAVQAAQRLAQGPTKAYGAMRTLFRLSSASELTVQLKREAETVGRIAGTEDAATAFERFMSKQPPTFSGR